MFEHLQNKNKYYFLLFTSIIFHSIISFENITFNLYFNSVYEEYGNFFKSFDFFSFSDPYLTFPIWGYGFFYLFFGKSILLNLLIQQFITFITLVFLDREIIRFKFIHKIEYFRFLIIFSAPWFLFHTQMWPKSFASNLIILSFLLLFHFFKSKKYIFLILSAICFGVMQNFRSDYIYLLYLLVLYVYFSKPFGYLNTLKKSIFPVVVLILLTPWMIFTNNQTGKPLLTSTNGGHVLFIGLGQLPENNWGILPRDDDQIMDMALKKEFGSSYKSDKYHENIFLKNKFVQLIKEDPTEWIKKCFFAFRLLVLDPFYVGNIGSFQQNGFTNVKEIRKLEDLIYRFNFVEAKKLVSETDWRLSYKEVFQFFYTLFTKILGIILFISFLISLILSLYRFRFNLFKDKIIILLLLVIGYQIAISVFAFHMSVYNTTIYIFYLLLTYLLFQKYLSIKQ